MNGYFYTAKSHFFQILHLLSQTAPFFNNYSNSYLNTSILEDSMEEKQIMFFVLFIPVMMVGQNMTIKTLYRQVLLLRRQYKTTGKKKQQTTNSWKKAAKRRISV